MKIQGPFVKIMLLMKLLNNLSSNQNLILDNSHVIKMTPHRQMLMF
jgi:hypothetical protein